MAQSLSQSQERDALADIQSSRRSPPMTYHSLSIFDFMSYAFSGPAAMNSQEKKLLTADLETEDGVNEFIEALKSLRPSIETGPSKEEFLDRIASLRPTLLAQVVEGVKADKAMQQRVGKAAFLEFLEQCDILAKSYRPVSPHAETCLQAIEDHWGMRIANRYMNMGDSALEEMMTIASHANHSVAVTYLNAEILARKERRANGAKGHVPTGHGITISDAKSARAKVVGKWKVPSLSQDLLAKYKLRVSKETGLLKSVAESESDDEDDVEDEDQAKKLSGGEGAKTRNHKEQIDQHGDDELNIGLSTQSGKRKALEQPEDEQRGEKRARPSTNASEESASEAFLADLKAFLEDRKDEEKTTETEDDAERRMSQEIRG
ncbi:hypothetical protein HDK77DRAFT_495733 [Phyllosticta capitalensis]